MELPGNVIKHYLRNVYFLSGSACGGKTTIARHLANKHGLVLYNWDERYVEHKALSDAICQPAMHMTYGSWDDHFGRAPAEIAEAVRRSIREQVEIAIVELLNMAADRRIIVEGVFPCDILSRISDPSRVFFLMADMDAVRSDFFGREDKADMLRCIQGLRDPQGAMENVFLSIEHALRRQMAEVEASGFRWVMRGGKPDWESIQQMVEQHFGLNG